MRLDQKVEAMRAASLADGRAPVASRHQGVRKERIQFVLKALSLDHPDIADAVFALLDDTRPSWFSSPPSGARFCDGATTAHVACHVGILQRGTGKLDREGRDYWLKPLRNIGAIEACYLTDQRVFVLGHPIAKSPNNCYRLDPAFTKLLQVDESVLADWLQDWSSANTTRQRLALQGAVAFHSASRVRSGHTELISDAIETYVPRFLAGYDLLFTDIGDGERVSQADHDALGRAGLTLALGDPMPDVVLWKPDTEGIWVIEAVTSDGEVDQQKLLAVQSWVARHAKRLDGATTAYPTWKVAASRQGRYKNLAPQTYLWICEDPGRQYLVLPARF